MEKGTMEQIALPIVFAGHIDHGKSTLIGRLLFDTGVLKEDRYSEIVRTSSILGRHTEFAFALDALEEERERGITIDTTQITFSTKKRRYVIIDAPGHKEFLRNMITGASYAEAAILIIDASEGIREQTKRHAYLLGMVGIRQLCVVVNKMDLVDFSKAAFDKIRDEILRYLSPLQIEPFAFIPISALSGINVASRDGTIAWYKGPSLLEALDQLEYRRFELRPFRLPVQDIYSLEGEEIVLGRIESGSAQAGMEVRIFPKGEKARIKEIKKFMKKDIASASCGECVGLILEGKNSLRRGDVLAGGDDPLVSEVFDAHLFWFEQFYKTTETVKIRVATQETHCKIGFYELLDPATMEKKGKDRDCIEIGEVARAQIRTDGPIVVDRFDAIPEMGRFVIEKNGIPVGGGIVI